jgi:hypothetical protein
MTIGLIRMSVSAGGTECTMMLRANVFVGDAMRVNEPFGESIGMHEVSRRVDRLRGEEPINRSRDKRSMWV